MMHKIKRLLFIFFLLPITLWAQDTDTIHVKLSDYLSVYRAVQTRSDRESKFINTYFGLDSLMSSRVSSNIYTLNQGFLNEMKTTNYTVERIMLEYYIKIKDEKDKFMKMFLSEKDYKKYQKLVVREARVDMKKYANQKNVDPSLQQLREAAAGWDFMHQSFVFFD